MANKSNNKQGVVSWLTSVIALGIGLSNVFIRMGEASAKPAGEKWPWFSHCMISDYAGVAVNTGPGTWQAKPKFEAERLIRGYAPILGGVAFKKGTSYLAKTAKIKSLIPRLGL